MLKQTYGQTVFVFLSVVVTMLVLRNTYAPVDEIPRGAKSHVDDISSLVSMRNSASWQLPPRVRYCRCPAMHPSATPFFTPMGRDDAIQSPTRRHLAGLLSDLVHAICLPNQATPRHEYSQLQAWWPNNLPPAWKPAFSSRCHDARIPVGDCARSTWSLGSITLARLAVVHTTFLCFLLLLVFCSSLLIVRRSLLAIWMWSKSGGAGEVISQLRRGTQLPSLSS